MSEMLFAKTGGTKIKRRFGSSVAASFILYGMMHKNGRIGFVMLAYSKHPLQPHATRKGIFNQRLMTALCHTFGVLNDFTILFYYNVIPPGFFFQSISQFI